MNSISCGLNNIDPTLEPQLRLRSRVRHPSRPDRGWPVTSRSGKDPGRGPGGRSLVTRRHQPGTESSGSGGSGSAHRAHLGRTGARRQRRGLEFRLLLLCNVFRGRGIPEAHHPMWSRPIREHGCCWLLDCWGSATPAPPGRCVCRARGPARFRPGYRWCVWPVRPAAPARNAPGRRWRRQCRPGHRCSRRGPISPPPRPARPPAPPATWEARSRSGTPGYRVLMKSVSTLANQDTQPGGGSRPVRR